MTNLDDILHAGKPAERKKPGVQIDIEMYCPTCNTSAHTVYYDKDSKKVWTYCDNGHDEVSEMDLSWLVP